MNRKQWWVFAIASLVIEIFFWWLWSGVISAAGGSCTLLEQTPFYDACVLKHTVYGSFGTIFLVLFFVFLICGYLEKGDKK